MNAPRRILLVNALPLYGRSGVRRSLHVQQGLLSILSYLRARGVPVDLLDLHREVDAPQTIDEVGAAVAAAADLILARDFDLIAISCNSSYHYLGALDVATRVRQADSAVPIVVGGCHATAVPEDFCEPGSPFDVVVRGDGEIALDDLARTPRVRRSRPEVVDGPPLPLDTAYADFEGYPYWERGGYVLPFPLSRGCPSACVFCGGADRKRWRTYPVAEALRVVRSMIAAGPQVVSFGDPCFGRQRAWRREFLQGLVAMRSQTVFRMETRADLLEPADIELLAQLNVNVDLGLETGSPRMAEIMGKARDGERYVTRGLEAIDRLTARGVLTQINLLVNHPGEDPETLSETVALVRSLQTRAPRGTAYPARHSFLHFPGTSIAADLDGWAARTGTVVGHPTWWRERQPHEQLAKDVRTGVTPAQVKAAKAEILEAHDEIIRALPVEALVTWRCTRGRIPIRFARDAGADTAVP